MWSVRRNSENGLRTGALGCAPLTGSSCAKGGFVPYLILAGDLTNNVDLVIFRLSISLRQVVFWYELYLST